MDEILKMQVMVGRAQLQYHDHQMLHKFQLVDTILVPLNRMGPLSVGETIVRVKQPCRYDLFELYRLVHENNIHVHLRAIVPSFVGVMIIMDNLHH